MFYMNFRMDFSISEGKKSLDIWYVLHSPQVALVVKNMPATAGNVRDAGSIPRLGRSPEGGHGSPHQYSCLENPIDRGASQATVHRVAKSRTWLKKLSVHMHTHTHTRLTCSLLYVSSVQPLSHVWLFVTPWTAACQASLSITNSRSLLKFISIELVMPSNHLILCCPLLLLPSIFSSIRIFSTESALRIRWPKDWSFSFNISPSNENSELISFRMDCFM